MFIKFNHIEIKNFMSIGNGSYNIDNQGYVLINGINNNIDDYAKSNGSGKSSCAEAIVWALTNETIRGTKDIVNRNSSGGCKVILDFTIDDISYKILRTKDDEELGTNLKLFVNDKDVSGKGIRDTQKILEEYLPDLTLSLIGSVIVLGQGLPQRFTNNTPSGRKEVLEKLSKSDYMIEDIKDKLSKRKTELSEELRKTEDLILSEDTKRDLFGKQLIELKEDKALLNCDVDYESEIKKYEKILNELEDNQVDAYHYSQQLNEQLNNKLKEYQDWTLKVNKNYLYECTVIDDEYHINDLNSELVDLDIKIKNKQEEITKLENIKDICPTCGQKLPNVHKVDLTPYEEELEHLRKRFKESNATFILVSDKVKHKKEEILNTLNLTTESIKKEGQELRQLYNDISKQNEDYIKEINNIKLTIDKLKLNKENYEKQSKTIDKDIEDTESNLKELEQHMFNLFNERDKINQHISVVTKMTTFATRDFRGYLLSEVIKYINTKAKEYCMDIFETDKIEFVLDGNNISITYCEKDYENLSGGEKQRIDLIIQFAIRDMLCQFMNFSSNLIMLDEVFDGLDSIACQNVINMLAKKLNDIESVFIITHHADTLEIPYDKQLFVIKDNKGISRIE